MLTTTGNLKKNVHEFKFRLDKKTNSLQWILLGNFFGQKFGFKVGFES